MVEKKDHFRAPVSYTYRRKSPFDQLLEHMGKVRECIDLLGEGLIKYYKGDFKNISKADVYNFLNNTKITNQKIAQFEVDEIVELSKLTYAFLYP